MVFQEFLYKYLMLLQQKNEKFCNYIIDMRMIKNKKERFKNSLN